MFLFYTTISPYNESHLADSGCNGAVIRATCGWAQAWLFAKQPSRRALFSLWHGTQFSKAGCQYGRVQLCILPQSSCAFACNCNNTCQVFSENCISVLLGCTPVALLCCEGAFTLLVWFETTCSLTECCLCESIQSSSDSSLLSNDGTFLSSWEWSLQG